MRPVAEIAAAGKDRQTEVILVAAKQSAVESYMGVVTDGGFKPAIVDVDYFAMQNCFEANYPSNPSEAVALVDIGAHYGFFSLWAATLVGAEGAVISFEPTPDTAERLRLLTKVRELRDFLEQTLFAAPLDLVNAWGSEADMLQWWQAGPADAGDLRCFLQVSADLGLDRLGPGPGRLLSFGTYTQPDGSQALLLDGLESALNGNARARQIIIHGADYVCRQFVKTYGYLGRSLGCPALPNNVMKSLAPVLFRALQADRPRLLGFRQLPHPRPGRGDRSGVSRSPGLRRAYQPRIRATPWAPWPWASPS